MSQNAKHIPLKQTCDCSAKALLAYPTDSFPYQVLHVTAKRTPKMSFKLSTLTCKTEGTQMILQKYMHQCLWSLDAYWNHTHTVTSFTSNQEVLTGGIRRCCHDCRKGSWRRYRAYPFASLEEALPLPSFFPWRLKPCFPYIYIYIKQCSELKTPPCSKNWKSIQTWFHHKTSHSPIPSKQSSISSNSLKQVIPFSRVVKTKPMWNI